MVNSLLIYEEVRDEIKYTPDQTKRIYRNKICYQELTSDQGIKTYRKLNYLQVYQWIKKEFDRLKVTDRWKYSFKLMNKQTLYTPREYMKLEQIQNQQTINNYNSYNSYKYDNRKINVEHKELRLNQSRVAALPRQEKTKRLTFM